jgi:hypothetical protein
MTDGQMAAIIQRSLARGSLELAATAVRATPQYVVKARFDLTMIHQRLNCSRTAGVTLLTKTDASSFMVFHFICELREDTVTSSSTASAGILISESLW